MGLDRAGGTPHGARRPFLLILPLFEKPAGGLMPVPKEDFKKVPDTRQGESSKPASGRKKFDSIDQPGRSIRRRPKLMKVAPKREGPLLRDIQNVSPPRRS